MLIVASLCEIDMKQAAISIWRDKGVISEDTYNKLAAMEKKERVITSGLMRKEDPKLTDVLYEGYKEYAKKLLELNDISEDSVLEYNFDAVFLIDCIPTNLQVTKYIKYAVKHVYTIYFKYNNLHFYLDESNNLHTRGVKHLEDSPFLKMIEEVMCDYVFSDVDSCYKKLHDARIKLEKDPESFGENLGPSLDYNLKIVRRMIKEFLKK